MKALMTILLLACGLGPQAARLAIAEETDPCEALVPPEGVSFSAVPEWVEQEGMPRYCRVQGLIAARIRFEMRLPVAWRGTFVMAGCGGFCGELQPDIPRPGNAIVPALRRGHAAIAHDSGHQAPTWETGWARDPEALRIWAHEVLPLVTEAGVAMATSLYGRAPVYRYFNGCSNGGRLAAMAAQRYPELFHGIAMGDPILDLSGTAGLWGNWVITSLQGPEGPIVDKARVPLLRRLVLERCDSLDGSNDGVIRDPSACEVEFDDLACTGVEAGPDCLSAAEVRAVKRLYAGVLGPEGDVVYPAQEYGSEHFADIWLFPSADGRAWGGRASAGYRQLLAMSLDEPDEPAGLSTERMLDWIARSPVPALTDAKNPDLSAFAEAGGKLVIYQGLADPLIIPAPIIDYYEQAASVLGGMTRLRDTARLFTVPGFGHCWEKPAAGPDDFDPLAAVERWVEAGEAPDWLELRGRPGSGQAAGPIRICAHSGPNGQVDDQCSTIGPRPSRWAPNSSRGKP